jgi:hypothetical protein
MERKAKRLIHDKIKAAEASPKSIIYSPIFWPESEYRWVRLWLLDYSHDTERLESASHQPRKPQYQPISSTFGFQYSLYPQQNIHTSRRQCRQKCRQVKKGLSTVLRFEVTNKIIGDGSGHLLHLQLLAVVRPRDDNRAQRFQSSYI